MQRAELLSFIKEQKKHSRECYYFLQILESFVDFTSEVSFENFKEYIKINGAFPYQSFNQDLFNNPALLSEACHTKFNWTQPSIHRAVSHPVDIDKIENLVKKGADINIRGYGCAHSITPLIQLLKIDNLAPYHIDKMIELGANIYFKNEDNNTCLDILLRNGNSPNDNMVEVIRLLLRYGVDFSSESYVKRITVNNNYRIIQNLLYEAKDSSVELIPFIQGTIAERHIPKELTQIITSYSSPKFYGYFFKNTHNQLFLEEKKSAEPKKPKKSVCCIS